MYHSRKSLLPCHNCGEKRGDFPCTSCKADYCFDCYIVIHKAKDKRHHLAAEKAKEEEPDAKEVNKHVEPPRCKFFSEKGYCKFGSRCNFPHICPKCDKDCNGYHLCKDCTSHCPESFFCQLGLKCNLFHSKRERTTFQLNRGIGLERRGTEKCEFGSSCTKFNCKFAHNKSEMICIYCLSRGDHIGRECPHISYREVPSN